MNILILEDNPYRTNKMLEVLKETQPDANIQVVTTADEAIFALGNSTMEWDFISLDHDLGGEEMVESGEETGYQVAKWLAENSDKQPNIIWIHSLNPIGRKNMLDLLPDAEERPFWWQ